MARRAFPRAAIVSLALVATSFLAACQSSAEPRSVVVYTSVDQVYSEPILREFQQHAGVRVLPVYDIEAAKTTGLVNRLLAEKDRPQADVFWSGEFAQTLLLKEQGVLEPYRSSSAADIPAADVDPDGYWTGFAGRARVLLVNTDLVSPADYPRSITDLVLPAMPGDRIGIANPLFGTMGTHAAALYAALGPDAARSFFAQLRARGVQVVDGNSVVKDSVADGRMSVGLVDTDDACQAVRSGKQVAMVFPDQEPGDIGTLVVPNTVAIVARAPHPAEARMLVDFLLGKDVERELVSSGWSQVPLRTLESGVGCVQTADLRGMTVTPADVYRQLEAARTDLTELFLR
jgi:iron(III) transport system substrate-binding protein